MSKNNNEEILLPKTKAVPKEDFYLKNLSADQIVKLVSGFKPGVAQSGNVLASAFGPLADEFIQIAINRKSNLVDQLKYIKCIQIYSI